jgi:phosphate transport system substrate-binding protein
MRWKNMKFKITILLLLIVSVLSSSACSGNSGRGGGNSNYDTSINISVTAREDGSGTKNAFMEIIGLKGKSDPAGVIIQNATAGVLTEVKGNPAAIGYESLGYVTGDVRMLKVDGAEATVANIKNSTYKISRPLSVVYQDEILDSPLNNAFYIFLQSKDVYEIITEEGYVSILDATAPYTVDGSLSGTINISGSTSLKPLMDELAIKFCDLQPGVTVNVGGGGSGQGYNDAAAGVSEFGMISEEFNEEKAPGCVFYTVCQDGIAIIVHKDNPLDSITMDQLKGIYDAEAGANAITGWSEIIK